MRRQACLWLTAWALATAACAVPTTSGALPLDDAASTRVNEPVDIPVLLNDWLPEGREAAVTAGDGAFGATAVNTDGTIRYTPAAGQIGLDSFTYEVTIPGAEPARAVTTVDVVGEPDLVIEGSGDLGEVFVGVPARRELVATAIDATFSLLSRAEPGLSMEPDPACRDLAAGSSCRVVFEWESFSPGPFEVEFEIAGGVPFRITGNALPSFIIEGAADDLAVPVGTEEYEVGTVLHNVANGALPLPIFEGAGIFAASRVDLGRGCTDPLPPGGGCEIVLRQPAPSAGPGERHEGELVAHYLETTASFRAAALIVPGSPQLRQPIPGQQIFANLLVTGFSLEVSGHPTTELYEVEVRVCWEGGDGPCDQYTATVEGTGGWVAPPGPDPAPIIATLEAAEEAGVVPEIVIRVHAIAGGERSTAEWVFATSWVPFEIRPVEYVPPNGSILGCSTEVSYTLDYVSHLVGETTVIPRVWTGFTTLDPELIRPGTLLPGPDGGRTETAYIFGGDARALLLVAESVGPEFSVADARFRYEGCIE